LLLQHESLESKVWSRHDAAQSGVLNPNILSSGNL
jgi:hypothetical protein